MQLKSSIFTFTLIMLMMATCGVKNIPMDTNLFKADNIKNQSSNVQIHNIKIMGGV